jgi:hypothetical protein
MAGLDRKQVVVVDGGYESYDIERRVLAPMPMSSSIRVTGIPLDSR